MRPEAEAALWRPILKVALKIAFHLTAKKKPPLKLILRVKEGEYYGSNALISLIIGVALRRAFGMTACSFLGGGLPAARRCISP